MQPHDQLPPPLPAPRHHAGNLDTETDPRSSVTILIPPLQDPAFSRPRVIQPCPWATRQTPLVLNASIGTGEIDTRSAARMPVGRGWQDSTTTEIRR
jgi:hypothetical protein